MTTWNPAIPVPTNVPSNDATSIQQNFQVLDAAFPVDHTALSIATSKGMHKQITFPQQPVALPFGAVAQQSYLYEKMESSSIRSFLEYQPSGGEVTGNPPFTSVVPISFKAFCVFQPLNASPGAPTPIPLNLIFRSFNVSNATDPSTNLQQQAAANFTVVFQEPIPTLHPFILFMAFQTVGISPPSSVGRITAISTAGTNTTGFAFTIPNMQQAANNLVAFGVF